MVKRLKKLSCLLLSVTMVATLFVGCGSGDSGKTEKKPTLSAMDDSKVITLGYAYWEDNHVVESLVKGWSELHPNATVNQKMTENLETHNQDIINLAASKQIPDVFWVLGSPENMIKKGLLYDMSSLWEHDGDTKNVIGGINDYKLGYFGTPGKWTTPVKFFPTVMFINLTNVIVSNNSEMPSMDWTWEDFEAFVEKMSHDNYYGLSEACTMITLYPIASDAKCQGEFGWDGEKFDMTNWADGMELERDFRDSEYIAPTAEADITAIYGSAIQPQDEGYVSIRTDHWWCWERFWNDSGFYSKNTFFVPYTVPHTEDNSESVNMFATIDFGAISSMSENKLEAYYLLKYMTWGAEGWNWKLDHYQEIRETAITANGGDINNFEGGGCDETTGGEAINNCPITLDEEVWAKYERLHPNATDGDPIADRLEAAGLKADDRVAVFEEFWKKVKAGKWVCYGSQQIPGFDTFLVDTYQTAEFVAGFQGIEAAVFDGDAEPSEYAQQLTDKANELANEYKDLLNSQITKTQ